MLRVNATALCGGGVGGGSLRNFPKGNVIKERKRERDIARTTCGFPRRPWRTLRSGRIDIATAIVFVLGILEDQSLVAGNLLSDEMDNGTVET